MLNLLSAPSIWDGPFSFMQHCRCIWLGWVYGGEHGIPAALRWVISKQMTSFAYDQFYACPPQSSKASWYPPIIPSPSVYCWKSHRANWDRAVKWSRRDVVPSQRKLDSAPSVCSVLSLSLCISSTSTLCAPHLHPLNFLTYPPLRVSGVAHIATRQWWTGQGEHDWKMR